LQYHNDGQEFSRGSSSGTQDVEEVEEDEEDEEGFSVSYETEENTDAEVNADHTDLNDYEDRTYGMHFGPTSIPGQHSIAAPEIHDLVILGNGWYCTHVEDE
jgi:hypothetical protein